MPASEDRGGEVSRGFLLGLSAVLAVALVHRAAYVWAQPLSDPGFARPMLDGAYYLDWARSLATGGDGPAGAFYLAPLYPHFLAGFLEVFGERFGLLYLLQHALSVGTAGLLGLIGARRAGTFAGLATAALCAFYAPAVFFASRPVGETLAIFLLALSLWQVERRTPRAMAAGGALAGLAALGRPNWLPLAVLWALGELRKPRGPRRAALLLGAAALVVLPVTVRNYVRTGHLVAVSSNGGITFYHGNGVGALGVFTAVPGVTSLLSASDRQVFQAGSGTADPAAGERDTQRAQATAEAIRISGRTLDPIEADRFWGRRALESRLEDPGGSVWLLLRRALLLVDSTEHSLDYNPQLDENPWRASLLRSQGTGVLHDVPIVSFALIFGLSATGIVLRGSGGSGGWNVWSAIGLSLATPLLFYVSSRYRLPAASLLALPAGVGLAGLLGGERRTSRHFAAAGVGLACLLGSLLIAFPEIERRELATGLSNRGLSHQRGGDLAAAERDLRLALELEPEFADARVNLGSLFWMAGRQEEAVAVYREALGRSPGSCRAAYNLASALIERHEPEQAIPPLRQMLGLRQDCAEAWTALVVALSLTGNPTEALRVAEQAREFRIELPAGLVEEVRSLLGSTPP